MPEKSVSNITVQRVCQITDSHCGPAVIQMLLGHLGLAFTQEDIAEAAGITTTIIENGSRVDQLAAAVKKIAPDTQFWYKTHTRLRELIEVINVHRFPVGVEWQGIFTDDVEEEDDDYGHYSVISHVDEEKKLLIIVDPYKDFVSQDRIFSFDTFTKRWWDMNEVYDIKTRRTKLVEDWRMMFLITPAQETFPLKLGMKKG